MQEQRRGDAAKAGQGPATQIYVLGSLRATIAGRRVDQQLAGRKGRLLFAFMVLNRHRTLSRGELIDVLWPSGRPASPDGALSTVLSRLRQAIGEGYVQGRADLSLQLPEPELVDTEEAQARVAAARQALHDGQPALALVAARAAVQLMANTLLPEFDDDWVEDRRRELADLLTLALESSARAALSLGAAEVPSARSAARRLIEHEPWRETGYALLMQAHARAGDVAEALRVFERLRVLLRDELGTRPSRMVLEIHQQLLSGDVPREPPHPSDEDVGLEEPATTRVTLPPMLEGIAGAPFVGRHDELRVLEERWHDVVDGEDAIVLVCGEAGIGKTALAARLARCVHANGATVLFGQCDEHSVTPYQPIAEALRHYCRQSADVWERRVMPHDLAELARIIPELRDRTPDERLAPAAGVKSQRYRLFEVVRSLLRIAAEDQPVLFILEDAHWADRSTLLLLRHVIRDPDRSRLLVLMTYRDLEVSTEHPLMDVLADLDRIRPLERLKLRGFSAGESAELIAAYAESDPTPEALRRWRERTDGHPFFLHEMLRKTDRAAIEASSDIAVPVSVNELIARRVARLDAHAARSLAAAAVIGRQFDLDVLTSLMGDSTQATIAALEEAIDQRLVYELPEQFDRFAFTHALVRDALYGQHSRTGRTRLHLRVGQLLEHALNAVSPGELAHHFFLARDLAGPEQAVRYCTKAAAAAVQALAYEDAIAHYRRALEALEAAEPDADQERCDLLLAMGDAQWRAGDPDVDATFAVAAASARRRGDVAQLARAALGGRNYESGAPDARRVALLEEALADFPAGEQSVLRVRVLGLLAEALHYADAGGRALDLSAEALDVARALEDPEAQIAALLGRHAALLHIEHVDERLSLLRELGDLAGQTGRPDLQARGHLWSAYAYFELGDRDGARLEHRALERLAERLREPGYVIMALTLEAAFAQLDGDLEAAERLALESHALAKRVHYSHMLTAQLFFIRREQGRLGELLPAIEAAAATNSIPTWRAGLTIALATTGHADRAQDAFEIAAHGLADLPRGSWWLATVAMLAEGCAHVGDGTHAQRLYDVLAPYADRSVQLSFAAHLGSVHRYLGLLAAAMKSWARAEEHFEAALRRQRDSRPLTIRTQCDYAQMLASAGRDGDSERAAALVERALQAAGEGSLRSLVEPAAGRLARRAHPAPQHMSPDLSLRRSFQQ